MNTIAKSGLLLLSGALLGAIVWLWSQLGNQVFVTFAQSVASWCF